MALGEKTPADLVLTGMRTWKRGPVSLLTALETMLQDKAPSEVKKKIVTSMQPITLGPPQAASGGLINLEGRR